MSTPLEEQLRASMQAPSAHPQGWQEILDGADKLVGRQRMIQRLTVAAFIGVLALGVFLFGSDSGLVDTPSDLASPTDPEALPRVSTPHLIGGLALFIGLVIATGIATWRRDVGRELLRGLRRWWLLISAMPIAYAVTFAADAFDSPPFMSGPPFFDVPVLKWLAILSLPVTLKWFIERSSELRGRWITAGTTWFFLGTALLFLSVRGEIVGAIALALASLSMSTLLWLWGGPVAAKTPDGSTADQPETKDNP